MNDFIIDTNKLLNCSQDFLQYTKDYRETIINIFELLTNLSKYGSWEGDSEKTFAEVMRKDKKIYLDFGDTLESFALMIQNSANSLDNTIKDCRLS